MTAEGRLGPGLTLFRLLLVLALGAVCAAAQPREIAGVASVIDGDTVEINGQSIRLHGIDAPERGARCGTVNVHQRAALALADILGRDPVRCAISGVDRYDRSIGVCAGRHGDVARALAAQGWARDWPRYSRQAYADAEREARAARRGLWGLTCPGDLWGGRNYD